MSQFNQFNPGGGDHSGLSKIGPKSTMGKLLPIVVLAAGWYVLPSGRARNFYTWAWIAIVAGLAVIDYPDGDTSKNPWGTPTVWSYLLWALGLFFVIQMFREVRAQRRHVAAEQAAWQPVPAPITPHTAPVERPEPVVAAPAPAAEPEEPEVDVMSDFWLPEPQRRVVRRGETLSGVKFTDRRAVDPRNL